MAKWHITWKLLWLLRYLYWFPLATFSTWFCMIFFFNLGPRIARICYVGLVVDCKTIVFQLPPELYASFIAAIEKGNIKSTTNRSMPATPHPTPGALLLGDAFNMRHPLTGGGMTVALADIVLLRDLLRPLSNLNDVDADALCNYLESFYTLRKVLLTF